MPPKKAQKPSAKLAEPTLSITSAFKKLPEHIRKAGKSEGDIRDEPFTGPLKQALRAHRTKATHFESKFVIDLVSILNDGGRNMCSRLDAELFCIIVEVILQSDYCQESERGLFLLAESLRDIPHQTGGTRNHEARKTAIGKRCDIDLVLGYFVDASNHPGLRRWVGILCIELVDGSEANVDKLNLCSEGTRRSIGALVIEETNEIIRFVCGKLIRVLQRARIDLEHLWPTTADRTYFNEFPAVLTQEDNGWSQQFHSYVDEMIGLLADGDKPDVTSTIYCAESCSLTPMHRFGGSSSKVVIQLNEESFTILAPPTASTPYQILDVPVEAIDAMILLLNTESQVADTAEGLVEMLESTSSCHLDGEAILLKAILIISDVANLQAIQTDLNTLNPKVNISSEYKEATGYSQQSVGRASQASCVIDLDEPQEESVPALAESSDVVEMPTSSPEEDGRVTQLEEVSSLNENDDIYDASPINKGTHVAPKASVTVAKQSHTGNDEVMLPPRKPHSEEKAGKLPRLGPKPKAKAPIKFSLPSAHPKPSLPTAQTTTSRVRPNVMREQATDGKAETRLPRPSKVTASGSIKDDTINSEPLTNPDYRDISTPRVLDTRATTVEKDGPTINLSQSQAKKPTRSEKLKKDLNAAATTSKENSQSRQAGQVKTAPPPTSDAGDVYDILPDQDDDYEPDKKKVTSKSAMRTKAKAKSQRSSQPVVKEAAAKSRQEVNKLKAAPAALENMTASQGVTASQRVTRSAAMASDLPKTAKTAADQLVAEPKKALVRPQKEKPVRGKIDLVDEVTSSNPKGTKIADLTSSEPKPKAKQPLRMSKALSMSQDELQSSQMEIDPAEVINANNKMEVDTVNVDTRATEVDVKQQTGSKRSLPPPRRAKWQKDIKHAKQKENVVVTHDEMGVDMMEVDDALTQIKPLRGPKNQLPLNITKERLSKRANDMSTTTRLDLASKLDSLLDFSDREEGIVVQSIRTRMKVETNKHSKGPPSDYIDELADVSPIKKTSHGKPSGSKTKPKTGGEAQEKSIADTLPTTEPLEPYEEVQNGMFDPPSSSNMQNIIAGKSAKSTHTVEHEKIASPEDCENSPSSSSASSAGSRKRRGSAQQDFPMKKRKSDEPQVTAKPASPRRSPRLAEKTVIRIQEDAAAKAGVMPPPEWKLWLPIARTPLKPSPAHSRVVGSSQKLGMMQAPQSSVKLKAKTQTFITSPRRYPRVAARKVVNLDDKQKDYEENSLVDERSCRKPVVIGFSRKGPRNQGSLNKSNGPTIQTLAIDSAIANNQSHRAAMENSATTPRIAQADKKRKRKDGEVLDAESPPKKQKNSSPEPQQPIEDAQGDFDPVINSAHDAIPSSPPAIASVPTIVSLRQQKPSSQASRVDVNGSPLPSASSQKINHIRRVQQKLDMAVDQPGEADAQRPIARRHLFDVFGPRVRLETQAKARPSSPEKSEARYVPHHKTKLGQYEGISTNEVIQPQESLPDPFVEKGRRSSDFTERLRGSVTRSNCRPQSVADVPEKVKIVHEVRQQFNESIPDLSSGSSATSSSHGHARTPLKEPTPQQTWNLAIRPHYTSLREAVHRIADEMIIRLSDEEDKMGLLVNQYRENGTKVLETMIHKRADEKSTMRRVLLDKKNSMMSAYNEAKKSISRAAEKLKEAPINLFEKEWRNRQSFIRDRIVKAGSNGE